MSALRIILLGAAAGAAVAFATSKTGRQIISSLVDEYGDKFEGITDAVKSNADKFIKNGVSRVNEKLAV